MPIKLTDPRPTGVPGIVRDGGRYFVRVGWTCPKTGKRKQRRQICKTLSEAVAVRERRDSKDQGIQRVRLRDYAAAWLTMHASRLAPTTQARYCTELGHVLAHLGDHFVDSLEVCDIERYVSSSLRDLAPRSVNGRLRILRQLLGRAHLSGVAASNPAAIVPLLAEPAAQGARAMALTAAQFSRFVRAVPEAPISPDVGRMILAAAWTGARRSELRALRWDDIRGDEVWIIRALSGREERCTKTGEPRVVAIAPPLAVALADQRRWLVATQHPGIGSGLVFPASPRGAATGATRRDVSAPDWHRGASSLSRPLAAVCATAGLPRISLHALRRTFEDLLRRAGVDQLVRRSLAGWRSDRAQAIYAGVAPEERAAAVAAVVRLVSAPPAAPPGGTGPSAIEKS